MPGAARGRRAGGNLAGGRSQALPSALVSVVFAVLAAALVFAATQGQVGLILAVGASAYLLLITLVGLRKTAALTLMAAFATAPMYKGIASSEGATVTPTDLLLILGLLILVPTVIHHRVRLPTQYVVGLMVLFVMGLTASGLADEQLRSFFDLAQLISVIAILPLAVAVWGPSPRMITLLAVSYVAGHMVSTVYGLATGPFAANRYAGLSHHPNAFSEAGLMAFALLLFLYYRHRSLLVRGLVVGALALSATSVVLSGSRAAAVVLAALVVMIPVVERSALWGFLLATAGALTVAVLPWLIESSGEGSALRRLAGTGDADFADSARRAVLEAGVEQFFERPVVGSGFADVELIHNVFLEIAVATGVIGLAGFLLVMFTWARPLFYGGELRRLSYTTWAFIGLGATVPGLQDRTLWMPMVLSILAAVELNDRLAARPHPGAALDPVPTVAAPSRTDHHQEA